MQNKLSLVQKLALKLTFSALQTLLTFFFLFSLQDSHFFLEQSGSHLLLLPRILLRDFLFLILNPFIFHLSLAFDKFLLPFENFFSLLLVIGDLFLPLLKLLHSFLLELACLAPGILHPFLVLLMLGQKCCLLIPLERLKFALCLVLGLLKFLLLLLLHLIFDVFDYERAKLGVLVLRPQARGLGLLFLGLLLLWLSCKAVCRFIFGGERGCGLV